MFEILVLIYLKYALVGQPQYCRYISNSHLLCTSGKFKYVQFLTKKERVGIPLGVWPSAFKRLIIMSP